MEENIIKIAEISNRKIKISPHSITVKNDDGKTCGVVRDVRPYNELRTAEQMEYHKKFRDFGVFNHSELVKCFVLCDGEPYFLHNLRPLETYERLFKGKEGWENEERKYNERKQAAEKMAEIATVIPCYVM